MKHEKKGSVPEIIPNNQRIKTKSQITICEEIMSALGWEIGNHLCVEANTREKTIKIKKYDKSLFG